MGREAELRQLHTAFDNAVSGQGALVMVVGEPGIGKTSLCEQLATYVTLRGGRTLVGHCYEAGSLSLPYLAFVEAIRSYVLSRDSDDLRREMGSGASEVARIVSEVRDRMQVEPREPGDPEEDRYRLLQSVSDFLRNAATVQPLVIVLEDLHDADRGTLDMLTHMARNLRGARLLLVGTYRDVEVDRSHPLSGALAELRRISSFSRVPLRGLTADEVQRMMSGIADQEVPWGLSEAVRRQTEGNPLFVQEVVRYLVEEGLVAREGGPWRSTGQTPLDMSIPEGLRDVIGKRLSRLGHEGNRLLSTAAVIGREFRLDVLQRVAGVSEEELFSALEEAQGAAVIEERSSVGGVVSFWFTHAFFQQTLYEETFTPRRIRLHQQVGQTLEEVHAARLEEHGAELVEHFSNSSDPVGLEKALRYSELAAQRAISVYAYGEGVRLLEQALQVQDVLAPEDREKRCDLLLALSDALLVAGEPRRLLDIVAPEALSLAEAMGDSIRASRICQLAIQGLALYGGALALGTPEAAQWAERADRYAQPDTIERALADVSLGAVRYMTGHPGEGYPLISRALDLARRLDDPDTFWWAATVWLLFVTAPQHGEEGLRLAGELAARPRAGVRTEILYAALVYIATTLLCWGQRGRAEEILRETDELAQRTGQGNALLFSLAGNAVLATLDGRLEDAVAAGQHMTERGEELGLSEYARVLESYASGRPLLHLGRYDDDLQLPVPPKKGPSAWRTWAATRRW